MRYPILLFLAASLWSCAPGDPKADLLIYGGNIYTLDEHSPMVEAVAVKGEKIIAVGTKSQLLRYQGEKTKVIDLRGRTMTPGLIEGHGHLLGLGFSEMTLNLDQVTSYEALVEKVKEAVAKAQPGEWIVGRGWHQEKWDHKPQKMVKGFQTHELLSAVSPNNPVWLVHASGHAGFANAKAMQLAGINPLAREQTQPRGDGGGEILRDPLGNPTGIFVENAQSIIRQHIPVSDSSSIAKAFDLAQAACLRNGITAFHDAGEGRKEIDLLKKFHQAHRLKVRLYEMISGSDRGLVVDYLKRGPEIDTTCWLTIRSIKLYSDGALGSRGAWLLEPYSDRKETAGMPLISMDTVLMVSDAALQAGFQVCTHAIGDRANREVLDRYEQAFQKNPAKSADTRFRIEHAQHIHPADIPRFAKLGVIASMQAIHLSSDRPWAIDRLGAQRIRESAYMWQSLLRSGAHVVNGTDVPVEPINPIANFFAAVTRQTLKGLPSGGYEPEEKMTRAQALKSCTLDAAYAAFQEKWKGSIEKGKLADFTVFSQDLMTVPDSLLLKTEVSMTIVAGNVEYSNE